MDLKTLFKPRTVAVVGVSLRNDLHPANVIYHKNSLRQQAQVFPVNDRGGLLHGETVYAKLEEIPRTIDLAVIATRADLVADRLTECIRTGVRGAVVISGGFAESGRPDLEERLVSIAREADFPFIGPNCLGIYSPPHVDTFFLPPERVVRPERGPVALISQSGGILVDHMIKFVGEGVGVSIGVSIGNKALIREVDLIEYFSTDPETKVIAFYVEGFREKEGRAFVLAADQCPKPIIVLKSGKTAGGMKAVSSHTASIAGDYEVFSSVLSQYGVLEARDESELISFCEALSCYQKPNGGKIGIITGSGGHGALAVDNCYLHGLSVPLFDEAEKRDLREQISERIRPIASLNNPIDLTGSAVDDDFVAAARFMSRKEELDCVLILLLPYTPGITSDLGARLSLLFQQQRRPFIAYVPHVEKYSMFTEGFQLNQVPVAHSIEEAVHMAVALGRRQPC
jgi:acetyltransferase